MRISIAAPFFDDTNIDTQCWLERQIDDKEMIFDLIPRHKPLPKWHDRKSKFTTFSEWFIFLRQAHRALKTKPDIIVTVFPQLTATCALKRRLSFGKKSPKMIAWLFNVGTCEEGIRKTLSSLVLSDVEKFVVHTRREIDIYSTWLKLPRERFVFAPYQSPNIDINYEEDTESPFIAAMGSAHRDYSTLINCSADLNIRTVIATGRGVLEGIDIPKTVETPYGINRDECLKLTQQARISIVPMTLKDEVTAAGQITIVEGMMLGRPMIVSDCYGASDYITHGVDGWLVPPGDKQALSDAITKLWNDSDLRNELSRNARKTAQMKFSDAAAGSALEETIKTLA